MVGGVIGAIIMSAMLNILHVGNWADIPWYYHLFMGGFLFGIVYMATDPVTAATTNIGKWIYGIAIGIIAILVRTLNPAYPEGTMLAILLMNVTAPLIDHLVIRAYVRRRLTETI